jgi:hypothetical protein
MYMHWFDLIHQLLLYQEKLYLMILSLKDYKDKI